MTSTEQGRTQPKTPEDLPSRQGIKVDFADPESVPVPFADVANVQVRGGAIIVTFGRLAIPFNMTKQEIEERAKRGLRATTIVRVALPPQAAYALKNVLEQMLKKMEDREIQATLPKPGDEQCQQ